MKIKIRLILLILILETTFGCASFSEKVAFKNQFVLKDETINKLNGFYEIGSLKAIRKYENTKVEKIEYDSINRYSLFEVLRETNPTLREDIKTDTKNYKIKVRIVYKDRISFCLLKNENKIDSISLNYKIRKDGFIYLKNKNFKTKWIPLVCGNFEINRTKIGLTNENNLILSNSYFIYGAVLFIIGDTRKSNFSSEYKRKL